MFQVGGHGEENPNATWLATNRDFLDPLRAGSRGMWMTYALAVTLLHLFLLCVPFLTVPMAWTLTNLFHNFCNFVILHVLKGAPWEAQDQGLARRLTTWEQIDYGVQFTTTRKFLTIVPIILFFLVSFYTDYDPYHFFPNFVSLVLVLLPKLPQFHCVRIFGINKY